MTQTLTKDKFIEKNSMDIFDTEYLKKDLKGRSVRGGAITFFSQGCKFVFKMGSTIVLARLLTPDDFGLIAMVAAITNFAMIFKDMGLSRATVQRQEINHSQISTLFWINAAIGLLMAVSVAVLAPVVVWFYGRTELRAVTIALGCTFIFSGLSVQHQALLRRNMRFFALGIVEISAMAVAITLAIIAGFCGAGYWSLIVLHVSLSIFIAAGMWIAMRWKPGLPQRGSGVRGMLGFGGNVAGFRLVNYFARNLDNILIGRFCGSSILGFYSKAYGLLMLPIIQIRAPLNSVAISALSRIQDEPKRYVNYYAKLLLIISFISMPLTVLLGICAPQIIHLLLGDQWMPAAVIFQILAITAFIQPASTTMGVVLLSQGQSGRLLRLGVFKSLCIVTSFGVGINWGAIGVAVAYAISTYFALLPSLWYCFQRTPVSITAFVKAIFRPAISSLVMGVVIMAVYHYLFSKHDILVISVCFGLGLVAYLLVWVLMPGGMQMLRDLYSHVSLIFPKKKRSV
ncbi:MAG: lipopolysaccharide biosynthesis protein [Planctomycetes bacterium]|nr:lipopolysaccharide biosynthesis protein [Planctomycetota bacterium]